MSDNPAVDHMNEAHEQLKALLEDIEAMTPAEILVMFERLVNINNQMAEQLTVQAKLLKSQESSIAAYHLMLNTLMGNEQPEPPAVWPPGMEQ